MPVYWSILIVTSIIGVFSYTIGKNYIMIEGDKRYKTGVGFAVVAIAYIVFFVGLRDSVLDTYYYVGSFKTIPINWKDMIVYAVSKDSGQGFYFLEGVFKILISKNHYTWLTFVAAISCIGLFKILYKYSIDFPLTMYLFIAGTNFTWLLNGVRQFLVVCLLFAFSDWLIEKKKIRYIILALILSTVHASALFVIPVCLFVSAEKIFGKRMMLFALATVIGVGFSENIFSFIDTALGQEYSLALDNGAGSGIMRLVVAIVPLCIVLVAYRYVKANATPSIILAINMSFIGSCFYLASTFTNGILVGRMPIYFTVYNLYLIPWLIRKCFNKKSSRIVYILCVILYLYFFYYQMHVAWGGLEYVSEILNLSYY